MLFENIFFGEKETLQVRIVFQNHRGLKTIRILTRWFIKRKTHLKSANLAFPLQPKKPIQAIDLTGCHGFLI